MNAVLVVYTFRFPYHGNLWCTGEAFASFFSVTWHLCCGLHKIYCHIYLYAYLYFYNQTSFNTFAPVMYIHIWWHSSSTTFQIIIFTCHADIYVNLSFILTYQILMLTLQKKEWYSDYNLSINWDIVIIVVNDSIII